MRADSGYITPATQFAPLPKMCREAAQGQYADWRWTLQFRPESTRAVCCQNPRQIRIGEARLHIVIERPSAAADAAVEWLSDIASSR